MQKPIRILFVCHGNICRSPLAEFVMKDLVHRRGLDERFDIASAATRTDEIGHDVYPPTRDCMERNGVPYERRAARQLRAGDATAWDYLIGMDDENIRDMRRMLGRKAQPKTYKLMEFAGSTRDVADPWYTQDFDVTYNDVLAGCRGLLAFLGF